MMIPLKDHSKSSEFGEGEKKFTKEEKKKKAESSSFPDQIEVTVLFI